MTQPIELYFWPTPNGWKISIALEEMELPYVMKPVAIGKREREGRVPSAQVRRRELDPRPAIDRRARRRKRDALDHRSETQAEAEAQGIARGPRHHRAGQAIQRPRLLDRLARGAGPSREEQRAPGRDT